jgi:hypothetical protein
MDVTAYWVGLVAILGIGYPIAILYLKGYEGLASFMGLAVVFAHAANMWRRLESDSTVFDFISLIVLSAPIGIFDLGTFILWCFT